MRSDCGERKQWLKAREGAAGDEFLVCDSVPSSGTVVRDLAAQKVANVSRRL
jgi:hypothetical protein